MFEGSGVQTDKSTKHNKPVSKNNGWWSGSFVRAFNAYRRAFMIADADVQGGLFSSKKKKRQSWLPEWAGA